MAHAICKDCKKPFRLRAGMEGRVQKCPACLSETPRETPSRAVKAPAKAPAAPFSPALIVGGAIGLVAVTALITVAIVKSGGPAEPAEAPAPPPPVVASPPPPAPPPAEPEKPAGPPKPQGDSASLFGRVVRHDEDGAMPKDLLPEGGGSAKNDKLVLDREYHVGPLTLTAHMRWRLMSDDPNVCTLAGDGSVESLVHVSVFDKGQKADLASYLKRVFKDLPPMELRPVHDKVGQWKVSGLAFDYMLGKEKMLVRAFEVPAGKQRAFVLSWCPSEDLPEVAKILETLH